MIKPLSILILLATFAGTCLIMAFTQRKLRPAKVGEAYPSNVIEGTEFYWV